MQETAAWTTMAARYTIIRCHNKGESGTGVQNPSHITQAHYRHGCLPDYLDDRVR